MVTEGKPSTDSVTISHKNFKLPDVSFVVDYPDKRIGGPAEKLPSETFNVGIEKQNYVLSAAMLLQ